LEHVRVSGKRIRPRQGLLVEATAQRIVVQRFFSEGRYDGLDLPIEEGDYALTEIREGAWSVKHAYYSREGGLKGEYFNVNTPVEIYPHGARYVDLEVDVVRRAGDRPFLVDREKLARLLRDGAISSALEQRAMGVAEGLMRDLGG
jgi:Ribonuclease G/E